MPRELDPAALVRRAEELNAQRMEVLRHWLDARGRTAAAAAEHKAAEDHQDTCYAAVVAAGWTAADLKAMNLPVPATNGVAAKARKTSRGRSSASTPTDHPSANGESAPPPDAVASPDRHEN